MSEAWDGAGRRRGEGRGGEPVYPLIEPGHSSSLGDECGFSFSNNPKHRDKNNFKPNNNKGAGTYLDHLPLT